MENELEWSAATVAPLAWRGLGTTLPPAVAEPAQERDQDRASSRGGR